MKKIKSNAKRSTLGRLGEEHAAEYYKDAGFTILERNFRAGRFAELDLIVQNKADLIIFVEVKTRTKPVSAVDLDTSGFSSIDSRKKYKLIMAAKFFLASHALTNISCQFDVVIVHFQQNSKPEIIQVTDAFNA